MTVPLHGQVAVSGTPQQLSPQAIDCVAFSIKAPLSNAHPVYVGSSIVASNTGYQLDPGDEVSYERVSQNGVPTYNLRPSDFWAVGTASDVVCWLASP